MAEFSLQSAIKSFMGYLEGTQKAAHTIRSYRSDLETFKEFLGDTSLSEVELKILEKYHEYLRVKGMSTNTRRRKVLTSRRLLEFLHKRGKVTVDIGKRVPAPYKVERVPTTFDSGAMIMRVRELPEGTALQARNRLLFWTLAETGALVSEVSHLKYSDYMMGGQGAEAWVEIRHGRSPRRLPISPELAIAAALASRTFPEGAGWAFRGYMKKGPLPTPMSDRAIELLARSYAQQLGVGDLTPRYFRHSAVLRWHREGLDQAAIRDRLGLKTDYAFRVYSALFQSAPQTISTPLIDN